MTYINWDEDSFFYIDPLTLEAAADGKGIPFPTYGNYAGPGYSGGVFLPYPDAPPLEPVDAFDALAQEHDRLSYKAITPEQQAAADVAFVEGIVDLKNKDLRDPEASLYAGATTLGFIVLLGSEGNLDLLSEKELSHAIRDAVHNVERGLAKLPLEDWGHVLDWLQDVAVAAHDLGLDGIDDALNAIGIDLSEVHFRGHLQLQDIWQG